MAEEKTAYQRALEALEVALDRNEPVILWGQIGIGKSFNVHDMAARRRWKVLELRVAQMEAIDLRGRPDLVDLGNGRVRTRFHPPEELPDPDRDGPEGVIFADELNLSQAADDVRAALFQLIDRGQLGTYLKPPGWRVVAACNPAEYNQLAVELPEPLLNRFAHLELPVPTAEEWVQNFAVHHEVLPSIMAFHQSDVGAGTLYQ
jgi:MoxR-like ATPase